MQAEQLSMIVLEILGDSEVLVYDLKTTMGVTILRVAVCRTVEFKNTLVWGRPLKC